MDALRGFRRLESDLDKILKYLDFIDMYLTLDEEERKVYHLKYPEEAKTMSRFAERFRGEGRLLVVCEVQSWLFTSAPLVTA